MNTERLRYQQPAMKAVQLVTKMRLLAGSDTGTPTDNSERDGYDHEDWT